MSMTVSARIEHKNMSKTVGQNGHDMRKGRIPDYVDKSRMGENSIIIEPISNAKLREICEQRRSKRITQRSMKKTASIATAGIITFGREAQTIINSLTKKDQDDLFTIAAEKMAEHLGSTLTGLVVHRDETAIHAHVQMPAYRMDGYPVSDTTDKAALKSLQDAIGEVFSHLNITRGTPKAERIARGDDASKIVHRSVRQLHDDLPVELEEAKNKLEKIQRLVDETEAKLRSGNADKKRLEKRLETYKNRLEKAEKAFSGMPSPVTITRIKSREKRFFGLLKDKIETERVSVIPSSKIKSAILSEGEKLNAREAHIEREKEELDRKRDEMKKEREEVDKMRSDAHLAYAQASEMMKASGMMKAQQIDVKSALRKEPSISPTRARARIRDTNQRPD